MNESTPEKQPRAQLVQEAIDVLFSELSHPNSSSINTEYKNDVKLSETTLSHQNGGSLYQLRYEGWNEQAEPAFERASE